MRILYILDFVSPYTKGGGGARISSSLIIKFMSKHCKCYILTQNFQKKSWKWNGIKVYPVFKNYFPKFGSLQDTILYGIRNSISFPYFFTIKDFIEKNKIDLIHIESNNIPLIRAAIAINKPIIIDIRDAYLICPIMFKKISCNHQPSFVRCFLCRIYTDTQRSRLTEILRPIFVIYEFLNHKLQGILLKRIANQMNSKVKFVALSKFIKNQLKKYGIPEEKIEVIYNISNIKDFRNKKYKKKNKIAFAGIIEKAKGIWDAIKAFELMDNKNLKFEIVGDGPELEAIKKYITEKNLKNIKLLGKLPHEKIPKLYGEAKIIIAPSIWPEPFGRFIQESAASKTPLITTKVGGIPEGVKNRKTGMLVEPNNSKQLAGAIKELLTNKKLYNKIVKNLEKEAYKYSPERIGKQRLKLYKKLLKNKK